jgi:soluble lytic murein transglycosylase-like protein
MTVTSLNVAIVSKGEVISIENESAVVGGIVAEACRDVIVSIEKFNKIESKNSRPIIEGIEIDEEVLEYIWGKSEEFDFDYLLVLAIIGVESNYGRVKKNTNNNGTVDSGIMQINSSNIKWLSELAGIDNVDPNNDYHSIDMAFELMNYERKYWEEQGYTGNDVELVTIMAYNMGQGNMKRYLKKYGLTKNAYAKKVYSEVENLKSKIKEGK